MAVQNDFFTWQSLATFAGTATATTAVTNGICKVLPTFKHVAALGLGLAILFCIVISAIDPSTGNIDLVRPFATYFIAVVNGFFVFASAAGLSAGGTSIAKGTSVRRPISRGATPPNTTDTTAQPESGFFRYWF
jgi:hypothetical protein